MGVFLCVRARLHGTFVHPRPHAPAGRRPRVRACACVCESLCVLIGVTGTSELHEDEGEATERSSAVPELLCMEEDDRSSVVPELLCMRRCGDGVAELLKQGSWKLPIVEKKTQYGTGNVTARVQRRRRQRKRRLNDDDA